MKRLMTLLAVSALIGLLACASTETNLQMATAREIPNTLTEQVAVSHVKRGATYVSWYATANGVCYKCDADDMVRRVHVVKVDCSAVPPSQP